MTDQEATPSFVRVVVDTTETKDRWTLDTNEWRILQGLSEEGLITVHFPEVVVRESERHLRAQRSKDERIVIPILHRMETYRGLDAAAVQDLIKRINADPDSEASFRSIVESMGFDILALPSVDHETLLKRDLGTRKPFAESGKGYRDALNWHSILELAKDRQGERIYWVTGNSTDFGSGALHEHLIVDLSFVENCADVVLCIALKQLLKDEGIKGLMEERAERLRLHHLPALTTDEVVNLSVVAATENLAYTPVTFDMDMEFGPGGLQVQGLGVPMHIESVTIDEAIPSEDSIEILNRERFDETTTFVTASVIADVHLSGYIYKSDIGSWEEMVVTDYDWNDHYAEVGFSAGQLKLTFDLRLENDDVESCELQGLESVDNPAWN